MNNIFKTAAPLLLTTALLSGPALAQTQGASLYAVLDGGSSGDPDGSGTAEVTINVGQQTLCYDVQVSGIAPATGAHIHVSPGGGLFIGLAAPTSGSAEGCVYNVDRQKLISLLRNPDDYYVNIHNAEYPGGAIGGTLSH